MNRKRGLNAYQTNQTKNRAQSASPYRLVQMMYENLLDSLAKARGGVERDDSRLRGENIGRAMDILNALRNALDHSANEEVAANLDSLYRYCNECLLEVTQFDDLDKLDEVVDIIAPIKDTWDQLGSSVNGAR